jgi:mxaD protein
MAEFEMEGDFDIPADALWGVLRNFGDVSWLPGKPEPVFEGEGPGMIRSVVIPPLPTARERLDGIDEEERRVRYRVVDGNPMPVCDYAASMQVIDAGEGRCKLRWCSRWEPDGVSEEEARKAVSQLYTSVLVAARRNLEKRHGS